MVQLPFLGKSGIVSLQFLYINPSNWSVYTITEGLRRHTMPRFSTAERFVEPYNEIPGPAAYVGESLSRPKTQSGGRIGTAVLPSCLSPLNPKNPGPNSYSIQDDVSKRCRAIKFQQSGKGRVPFPDPPPTPGPAAYRVKPAKEFVPYRLKRKVMGSFASKSKRESFLGQPPPGPGIGKYSVPTGNRWELPPYVKLPKGYHSFGANTSRYTFCGNLNHAASVPGPGTYDLPSFGRTVSTPALLAPSSASGGHRPRALGKQFERGVWPEHTFGADKDRFKDSAFGRLDLKALIPGPCAYDVVAALDHLESNAAAGASSRPTSPLAPSRPSSPHTFGASKDRHTYCGDLLDRASTPGPGQYKLPGLGGVLGAEAV